jgi:hypothetical protein
MDMIVSSEYPTAPFAVAMPGWMRQALLFGFDAALIFP